MEASIKCRKENKFTRLKMWLFIAKLESSRKVKPTKDTLSRYVYVTLGVLL